MVPNIRSSAARALAMATVAAGTLAFGGAALAQSVSVGVAGHFGGGHGGGRFGGGHFGGGHYYRPHYWSGGPRYSIGLGFGPYWGGYYDPYYYPYPYPYYRSSVIYRDDYDDRPYASTAGLLSSPYVQQALAAPVGESVTWASRGVIGRVTTTRDGWAGDKYCREFVQDITVDGSTSETKATACQAEGSAWQMVANQP